jgi:hypothetical protein
VDSRVALGNFEKPGFLENGVSGFFYGGLPFCVNSFQEGKQ